MTRVRRVSLSPALFLLLSVWTLWQPPLDGQGPPAGVVGGLLSSLQEPPPPPPARAVRVGGAVKPPTRTKSAAPVYPASAQSARVQGVVIIEAIIGADGRVSDTRVLRSIPLLDQAAIDAVKQWEYTPTILDGVAVPVLMTITVQFTLSDDLPQLQTMTPELRPVMMAELEKKRALWMTRRPAAYSLRITAGVAPQESLQVSVVRDGKPVSGTDTVEKVFDRLAEYVRRADRIAIAFDPVLGAPTAFQIDPVAATAGDEITNRIELTP